MKKNVKRFALTFGTLIAFVTLTNTLGFADNMAPDDMKVILSVDSETLHEIEIGLKNEELNNDTERRIKIFNSARQLIYESRDETDHKLCMLLRRSDLILQTETSSYYLLGD
jgi:hypothetical protein